MDNREKVRLLVVFIGGILLLNEVLIINSVGPSLNFSSVEKRTLNANKKNLITNFTNNITSAITNASNNEAKKRISIDYLSIGSDKRIEYLNEQSKGYSKHPNIRNFYSATERNDPDQACFNLTLDDLKSISFFCKRPWLSRKAYHSIKLMMQNHFANINWLKKKGNPVNWLCAQSRFHTGLHHVLRKEYNMIRSLPDYLILSDDDTFVDIDKFLDYVKDEDFEFEKKVYAGCLVRWPTFQTNFTFPWGGFGVFLNKAALKQLLKPIYCHAHENNITNLPAISKKKRSINICNYLKENIIGEAMFFEEGMALIDLMYAYIVQQPYSLYRNWSVQAGNCLHSDWFLGYFVNFYDVSERESYHEYYDNIRQERIHPLRGSSVYGKGIRECANNNGQCAKDAMVCHNMNETTFQQKFYPENT